MKLKEYIIKRKNIGFYCITCALFITFLILMSGAYTLVDKKRPDEPYKDIPLIIIDPGHGDFDGGAVGKNNVLEKDLNLAISKKVATMLITLGFKVLLTRTADTSTCDDNTKSIREKKVSDLHNRLKIANKNKNSVLVSIHQNKFSDSKYSGTQVFYSTNNEKSKDLAESIREAVKELLQPKNTRETKPSEKGVFILKNATNPAVIVECGFMSNKDEIDLLCSENYQNRLCFAICSGIVNYAR